MTRIANLSDDELRARRAEILRKLDISFEEIRERANSYALAGEEHDAWEELGSIAFLLGETRA